MINEHPKYELSIASALCLENTCISRLSPLSASTRYLAASWDASCDLVKIASRSADVAARVWATKSKLVASWIILLIVISSLAHVGLTSQTLMRAVLQLTFESHPTRDTCCSFRLHLAYHPQEPCGIYIVSQPFAYCANLVIQARLNVKMEVYQTPSTHRRPSELYRATPV